MGMSRRNGLGGTEPTSVFMIAPILTLAFSATPSPACMTARLAAFGT